MADSSETKPATAPVVDDVPSTNATDGTKDTKQESHADRKRKRFQDDGLKFGRGGKKRDMGRNAWAREQTDRRTRNEEDKKKPRPENSVLPAPFAQDEIAAEERKPKRKVAVLIGYSGTGYKGMQINTTEKTIEGDLFTAFVAAGAISKANADDPKKSALVRCARTDKGVHAAGNMISLKLIVEDPDIVQKINSHLSTQIRVWGIERTIGSFSCYHVCDSRWYEYLIPSHAFLPPHPSSWLAKNLEEAADEVGDRESYESRQAEVKDFWKTVEERDIKPIVDALDDDIRDLVLQAIHEPSDFNPDGEQDKQEEAVRKTADLNTSTPADAETKSEAAAETAGTTDTPMPDEPTTVESAAMSTELKKRIETGVKQLKAAYNTARRAYRIPEERIARVQAALDSYVGTRNYHNFTVQKTAKDPSAKRNIKSFVCNPKPIIINGTEWLSLKVHGQSFMMHQIRKMVGMVALTVRCGTPIERITEAQGDQKMSIPKVPGLGLLLERPVFDSYNTIQAVKHDKEKLDFGKYEKELEEFKQREIYQRIFAEEERDNTFHLFFNQIDNYKERHFLYLTSKGLEATKGAGKLDEERAVKSKNDGADAMEMQ
ncbi:pseudouridine synthase [Aureobasidium subglaciale]|nr:pseudouridine synthase [Aureobasidium subglaciale]